MSKLINALSNVETKVWTGASGAATGGVSATFLIWLIGVWISGLPFDAAHAQAAIASVPGVVCGVVGAAVAATGGAVGGWLAPHSARPDLAPEAQSVVNRAG